MEKSLELFETHMNTITSVDGFLEVTGHSSQDLVENVHFSSKISTEYKMCIIYLLGSSHCVRL